MNNQLLKILNKISDISVKLDCDLSGHSTMKLEARGDLILVNTELALIHLLKEFYPIKQKYNVLGWGANQLLKSRSPYPYIKLDFEFDKTYLDSIHELYELPASVSLAGLTKHASTFNLKGWDVFTGIPASLGGAVFMNAGTGLGEIGTLVEKVRIVHCNGIVSEIKMNQDSFSYRKNHFLKTGDIITKVWLRNQGIDKEVNKIIKNYLQKRNQTQPMNQKTCGCVFKNYQSKKMKFLAGECIDLLGLKGWTYKNLRISNKHANFIENLGGANYEEMVEFIKLIQKTLQLHYGIVFETEVKF
ncbi:MAG: hypothetical protein H6622_02850 [Halobacteriovoraceae bacterium]|nr:hypothetical protein [Halobacteriovoraceae bacterium]